MNPTYTRNLRNNVDHETKPDEKQSAENSVKIDGYKQILDMLLVADSSFRASLLHRIRQRDPVLARNLAIDLSKADF